MLFPGGALKALISCGSCTVAVLANKLTGKIKPVHADYVGVDIPDRFVFGCGLDVGGFWRNLPAIYAVKGT